METRNKEDKNGNEKIKKSIREFFREKVFLLLSQHVETALTLTLHENYGVRSRQPQPFHIIMLACGLTMSLSSRRFFFFSRRFQVKNTT